MRKFLLYAGVDMSVGKMHDTSNPKIVTPQKWSKWKAIRIGKYLLNDGWNINGMTGPDFKTTPIIGTVLRSYADTTGNHPNPVPIFYKAAVAETLKCFGYGATAVVMQTAI